jgi:protocatechuate 3,4-dioxygenase, alpha subunit
MSGITPSQTVGPYFKYGLVPNGEYAWNDAFSNDLVTADVTGERIRIEGQVFDGDGKIVPDAMLEIWQADAQGRFSDPQDTRGQANAAFRGFGRCGTSTEGVFAFHTIKPGVVPGPNGKPQARHILLAVYARGMTRQTQTRIYFADESANATDPILLLVPVERRETLLARKQPGTQEAVYRFDVHLQGDKETVFFDV